MSIYWAEVQHSWYLLLKKRNTGLRWASQLIRKLLNIAWDQWEHRNRINHRLLDNARHQHTSRLISLELRLGPRGLRGHSKQTFLRGAHVLTQDSSKHEAWLATVKAAFARLAAKQSLAESSLRTERSVMRRWLQGA